MEVADRKQTGVEARRSWPETSSFLTRNAFWLLPALFSVCYFGRTMLRASGKPFWYDEICTLYIVRLPTFADSWAAVMHGADYNPPLFYIIHRAFRALFGESQLALRLPEIFSFWIFCLCLFRFVSKRAGLAAGWIAMALPMLTGAYYYATEARPHGLVLGFLGLALICWQELQERPERWSWRLGFAAALGAAYFTHCYAVLLAIPFGLTELWHTVREKKIRWREWITLFIPPIAAVISFIPLIRSFRTTLQDSGFQQQFAGKLSDIPDYYLFILAPCWLLVAAVIFLYVRGLREPQNQPPLGKRPSRQELTLILSLCSLPVFGIVAAIVTRGPMFARYVLGVTAGCVLLLAFGCISRTFRHADSMLAILVALVAFGLFAQTVRLRHKGVEEYFVEPSTKTGFSRHPADPMELYSKVLADSPPDKPLAIRSILEFLYIYHYAPEARARLYPISVDRREPAYRLNKAVREWCRVDFNPEKQLDDFISEHRDFYFYGTVPDFLLLNNLFKRPGVTITSFKREENSHFLLHVKVATP